MNSQSKNDHPKLDATTRSPWDVVVIGAGVAGASMSILLAKQSLNVLLVEAEAFPRDKVCGGCLNHRAVQLISELGISDAISKSISINRLSIYVNGFHVHWQVPEIKSIQRSTLDSKLVDYARFLGVNFLDSTKAFIASSSAGSSLSQSIRLQDVSRGSERVIHSRITIVAAGLTRSPLPRDGTWEALIADDARIGVQCFTSTPPVVHGRNNEFSELCMIVSNDGYVGMCPTNGNQWDVAAALDPRSIREAGGIGQAVERILQNNHFQTDPSLLSAKWIATPLLTRQSNQVAKDGIYLMGDSAGYVEPFTGEGISWSLAGAKYLSQCIPMAIRGQDHSVQSKWTEWVSNHRKRNQRMARWVSVEARSMNKAKWILKGLDWMPWARYRIFDWVMR